ncbi:hypothetical protein MNV49_000459 [Pseudohyphozyma bogoriensis]|nr:hypothetical protein MNV49_000459 [Pseudohyphozyma bogoriensis]
MPTQTRRLCPLPALPAVVYPPPPPPKPVVADGFSIRLFFITDASQTPSDDDGHLLPPAFFPVSKISFAPRLRVTNPDGLPYSALGGMHLGVTGMCEMLNPDGSIKTKGMIADFCTDLTAGLAIWKRDAEAAMTPAQRIAAESHKGRLPTGTPPSFECTQFRIYYAMSITLFSSSLSTSKTPLRLKVFSVPFHVFPSTLPSPAPELPMLTHNHKKGVLASLFKSLSFTSPRVENGHHIVFPPLPTSHFSPGSQASIPVSLRIVDRPLEPTDLYIRLAVGRKTYVRGSLHSSLAQAVEVE